MKIGQRLQEAIFEETQRFTRKYIWLSVLKSNERAIHFYSKNGFKHIGEHTFNIGKEHFEYCVMAKELF